MDALTGLLVLCVCAGALAEPLGAALRRHSRYGVYANDFSRDYEPYVFAAVPLHAPMPVVRVLSPVPLGSRDRKHAPSVHHSVYARAPYVDTEYASSAADYEAYEPPQYASQYVSHQYAPYSKHYQSSSGLYAAASSAAEEPTILYARPNLHGGYTYHKAPNKHSTKRVPSSASTGSDVPYIIRVHKYRIVKER